MTKLTLSVQEDVVKQAKAIAAESGQSVSAMFSALVRSMAARKKAPPPKLGPITRKLSGVINLPPGKSDKELIAEALMARYNRLK